MLKRKLDNLGYLLVWNANSGQLVQAIRAVACGPITDIRWITSSLETHLLAATAIGNVNVYRKVSRDDQAANHEEFQEKSCLNAHSAAIESMDIDVMTMRLATVAAGQLKIWNIRQNCKCLLQF